MGRIRLILLAGVLGLSTVAVVPAPAAAVETCANLRQISVTPDDHAGSADISGVGPIIAYTSGADPIGENGDGGLELFTFDRTDGQVRQITDGDADDFVGSFGVDALGERIVFTWDGQIPGDDSNPDGNRELFRWDQDAFNPLEQQTETTGSNQPGNVTVSGNGEATFTSQSNLTGGNADGNAEVFLLDGGDTISQVTSTTGGGAGAHTAARISGFGSHVVYVSPLNLTGANADGSRDIFLDPIGAGTTVAITDVEPTGSFTEPLSPDVDEDGSHVVFQSSGVVGGLNTNGGQDVFLHTVGEGTELLVDSAADDQGPRISDNGVAVVWQSNGDYGGQNPDGQFEAWRLHLPTNTLTNVSQGGEAFSGDPEVDTFGLHVVYSGQHDRFGQNPDGDREAFLARCAEPIFSDVGVAHPFFVEILVVAGAGVVEGFSDGTFRPAATVTRQATAAFFFRLAGEPNIPAPDEPTFTDVPETHPFFHEIEWMALEGIAGGFPDGTYRPSGAVTRQSTAAFFFRFDGEPPFTDPATPTFTDVPETHPFFHEIEWMADEGISGGFQDGTFRPASAVTRQAMAAFIRTLI